MNHVRVIKDYKDLTVKIQADLSLVIQRLLYWAIFTQRTSIVKN
jgi:hypothetical protein